MRKFNMEDMERSIAKHTLRQEQEGGKNDEDFVETTSQVIKSLNYSRVVPPFMAQAIQEKQIEVEKQLNLVKNLEKNTKDWESLSSNFPKQTYMNQDMFHETNARNNISQENKDLQEKLKHAPEKLLHPKVIKNLAANMKTQVFGQDHVIDEMVSILSIACLNIRINKDKPAGCFFLAGPSGCGKTELSLALARFLGVEGRDVPFLKIDMGLFGMENDITKLIGPPPGYNGNSEGGLLTNFVIKNPISIILFDEMEKAHESMDKIFLSILDKGVCTDGKSEEAFFNNTIILVTSNLGAEIEYYQHYNEEEKHEYRMQAIYENLRPEIVNRFDSIFQCKALPVDIYGKIMNKFLVELYANIDKEHGVNLTHSEKLIDWATKVSYDPAMGGRPARKFIEKVAIHPLAQSMINEDIDFSINKNLILDLTESGNVCFKDKDSDKILGEMKNTKEIINILQANKFVKKGNKNKQEEFSADAIQEALAAMSLETSQDADIDVVNPLLNVKKGLKNPKVNRKSSRNDFQAG